MIRIKLAAGGPGAGGAGGADAEWPGGKRKERGKETRGGRRVLAWAGVNKLYEAISGGRSLTTLSIGIILLVR